jgi:hypothetical protein
LNELIVAIPARDEAATIVRCLTALCEQRGAGAGSYSVILLANNCMDDTAERAREFARSAGTPKIDVIEMTFESGAATVGRARGTSMRLAAQRFAAASTDGIIATSDADTVVDSQWIANTLAAMRDVDAVAGRIDMLPADLLALPLRTRLGYERGRRYAQAVVQLEATLDPTWWDPPPRHPDNFGASFAVRATAYRRVGGVPDRDCLEDLALYLALLRDDFRVRHTSGVRVATSGRRAGRVSGGLASFLETLGKEECQRVEDPQTTIENVTARAALRRYRDGRARSELAIVRDALRLPLERLRAAIDPCGPFGRSWEAVEEAALPYRRRRSAVDIDTAIAALETNIRNAAGRAKAIKELTFS